MEDWRPPIPAVIFVDTSIVLDLERFGEHIFDGAPLGPILPDQQRRQIEALRVLMALVDRAGLAWLFRLRSSVRHAPGHMCGSWRRTGMTCVGPGASRNATWHR